MEKSLVECKVCGLGLKDFFGSDSILNFTDFIYNDIAKKASKIKSLLYVFAHNAKGYDWQFVLRDLFQRNFDETKIIMTGHKILKTDVANVRFIDSLCFFQQPLASLPKSFGFENVVEKGFFPYFFNEQKNFKHNGAIPNIEYFGVKFMKPEKAKKCRDWYKKEKTKHTNDPTYKYNFKNELYKYCKNDVQKFWLWLLWNSDLYLKK